MVNNLINENTGSNRQSIENGENNSQLSKPSSEFKRKVNKLNTKGEGFNIDDVIDAIKTAIVEVVELEITTWVPDSSIQVEQPQEQQVAQPGNRMYTIINLIDGDINNEVGSQFVGSGSYTELREFHLSQIKESREIMQKNIESLQKLYGFFIEIMKSRKTSQQSPSRP
ncbi:MULTISPECIES: hypothetical protein [unclassified Nostoc]|uniref:hypothetical protein n=1 Tax=unclassified Nostoc TaxID=2593658 RepID=UPI002AD330BB|nr:MULTISPECIES: hypothetical protein [unclassified Nostoc]MDZ8123934.1 hypothetical protein [Nostoc sp. CmiVER01]MDZ8225566.1 hypothetical protein [Nostoc sp. ChiVER01]